MTSTISVNNSSNKVLLPKMSSSIESVNYSTNNSLCFEYDINRSAGSDTLDAIPVIPIPNSRSISLSDLSNSNAPLVQRISKSNPWVPYIGECKALDDFLSTKTGPGWLAPKFLNGLLRGVGQVVFANNPLTGLVILLSLFWADALVGLGATVAGTVAILTSLIFCQEPSQIYSGLTSYNAILIGTVTTSLWTPLYGDPIGFKLWGFIILGSALSVFVTKALSNMFASFKQPLPCLTLPFNIVGLILFTCLMPPIGHSGGNVPSENMTINGIAMELVQHLPEHLNNSLAHHTHIRTLREAQDDLALEDEVLNGNSSVNKISVNGDNYMHWGNILTGILLSMGQVYGVKNLVGSILMYFATMIYSPTVFMMSFAGATLGSIFGMIFSEAPYKSVCDGIWGFNGILSAIAVGGLFFVLTCHSFGTALANVVFTILIQQALGLAFAPLRLPFFTLPFVLSTLLFLSMSSTGDYLTRVTNITFPEMHRYEYLENQRINRPEQSRPRDTTDEIAEEKELVLKEVKVILEETPSENDQKADSEGNGKPTNGQTEKKETE